MNKKLFLLPIIALMLTSIALATISYPTDNAHLFTSDDYYTYDNLLDETASVYLPESNESGELSLTYQLDAGILTQATLIIQPYFSVVDNSTLNLSFFNITSSQNDLIDTYTSSDSGNKFYYNVSEDYIQTTSGNTIYITFNNLSRNATTGIGTAIGVAIANLNYTLIPSCDANLTNTTCSVISGLTINDNITKTGVNITIAENIGLTFGNNNNITGTINTETNAQIYVSNTNDTLDIDINPLGTAQRLWIRPSDYDNSDINFDLPLSNYNLLWKKNHYEPISDNNDRLWFVNIDLNGSIGTETVTFGDYWTNIEDITTQAGFQIGFDGLNLAENYTIIKKDGVTQEEFLGYDNYNANGDLLTFTIYESGNWSIETNTTPECTEDWLYGLFPTSCTTGTQTIVYTDANACGTTNDLPLDNGTTINCTVPTPPTILSRIPLLDPTINQGENQTFSVTVSEVDNDTLSYVWTVDSVDQNNNESTFTYDTTAQSGEKIIEVVVSDKDGNDTTSWTATIQITSAITGYVPRYVSSDVDNIVVDGTATMAVTWVDFMPLIALIVIIGGVATYIGIRKKRKGDY